MKKIKLSERTKNIGFLTAVLASATAINIIKDQSTEINVLNDRVQDLYDKAFKSLEYELTLESFIVDRIGEEVLQVLNS